MNKPSVSRVLMLESLLLFVACFILPFNGTMALRMLLLAILVVLAILKWRREADALNIEWPVLLWFVLPPLSVLWSMDPKFTARELGQDVLYPLLAFLSVRVLATGTTKFRTALWGAVSGVATVVIIGSTKMGPGILDYDWYALAHGWGQFSTLLALAVPCAGVLLIDAWQRKDSRSLGLALFCLGFILLGGYWMQNRMLWLSIILIALIWMYFLACRPEFSAMRPLVFRLCLGMALVLALLFYVVASDKPANHLDGQAGSSILAAFTHNERYEFWRFWFDRIVEKPWLGIGFGHDMPRMVYFHLKPEEWHGLMFAHAHNVLIDIAVQLGGLGCLLFLAALFSLFLRAWRAMRLQPFGVALAGAMAAALIVGILSKNMSDDFYSRTPLYAFWLLLGVAFAQIPGRKERAR